MQFLLEISCPSALVAWSMQALAWEVLEEQEVE
jgi:hypothetical protein